MLKIKLSRQQLDEPRVRNTYRDKASLKEHLGSMLDRWGNHSWGREKFTWIALRRKNITDDVKNYVTKCVQLKSVDVEVDTVERGASKNAKVTTKDEPDDRECVQLKSVDVEVDTVEPDDSDSVTLSEEDDVFLDKTRNDTVVSRHVGIDDGSDTSSEDDDGSDTSSVADDILDGTRNDVVSFQNFNDENGLGHVLLVNLSKEELKKYETMTKKQPENFSVVLAHNRQLVARYIKSKSGNIRYGNGRNSKLEWCNSLRVDLSTTEYNEYVRITTNKPYRFSVCVAYEKKQVETYVDEDYEFNGRDRDAMSIRGMIEENGYLRNQVRRLEDNKAMLVNEKMMLKNDKRRLETEKTRLENTVKNSDEGSRKRKRNGSK